MGQISVEIPASPGSLLSGNQHYACYMQFKLGAAAMGPVDDWSLKYYADLPNWYNWVYAIATFGGLLGGLALLWRKTFASVLFQVSFVAVIVMFGYRLPILD